MRGNEKKERSGWMNILLNRESAKTTSIRLDKTRIPDLCGRPCSRNTGSDKVVLDRDVVVRREEIDEGSDLIKVV